MPSKSTNIHLSIFYLDAVGCASEALKQVQLYRESLGKINKRGKISSLETEAAEKLLQALLTNNHQSLVELIPSDVKLTEHDKYLQKQLAQQQQQSAQPKESAAGRQTRSQSLHHACKAPTLAESLRKDAKLMEDLQSAKHLLNLFTLQVRHLAAAASSAKLCLMRQVLTCFIVF